MTTETVTTTVWQDEWQPYSEPRSPRRWSTCSVIAVAFVLMSAAWSALGYVVTTITQINQPCFMDHHPATNVDAPIDIGPHHLYQTFHRPSHCPRNPTKRRPCPEFGVCAHGRLVHCARRYLTVSRRGTKCTWTTNAIHQVELLRSSLEVYIAKAMCTWHPSKVDFFVRKDETSQRPMFSYKHLARKRHLDYDPDMLRAFNTDNSKHGRPAFLVTTNDDGSIAIGLDSLQHVPLPLSCNLSHWLVATCRKTWTFWYEMPSRVVNDVVQTMRAVFYGIVGTVHVLCMTPFWIVQYTTMAVRTTATVFVVGCQAPFIVAAYTTRATSATLRWWVAFVADELTLCYYIAKHPVQTAYYVIKWLVVANYAFWVNGWNQLQHDTWATVVLASLFYALFTRAWHYLENLYRQKRISEIERHELVLLLRNRVLQSLSHAIGKKVPAVLHRNDVVELNELSSVECATILRMVNDSVSSHSFVLTSYQMEQGVQVQYWKWMGSASFHSVNDEPVAARAHDAPPLPATLVAEHVPLKFAAALGPRIEFGSRRATASITTAATARDKGGQYGSAFGPKRFASATTMPFQSRF